MEQYERKRADIRRKAQLAPWDFSAGLAHVLATVAEPRSDDATSTPAFDAYVKQHRRLLIEEIDRINAKVSSSGNPARLGGQVEDALDRAAERLIVAAEKHNVYSVTDRLSMLQDERRLGVSHLEDKLEIADVDVDIMDIPRSKMSDRRVGLWR